MNIVDVLNTQEQIRLKKDLPMMNIGDTITCIDTETNKKKFIGQLIRIQGKGINKSCLLLSANQVILQYFLYDPTITFTVKKTLKSFRAARIYYKIKNR